MSGKGTGKSRALLTGMLAWHACGSSPTALDLGARVCVQEILGSTRTNDCTKNSVMQVCETPILVETGARDKSVMKKIRVHLTHNCSGVLMRDSLFLKLGRKSDTVYFSEESCVHENGRMPNPPVNAYSALTVCGPAQGMDAIQLESQHKECPGSQSFMGASKICVGQGGTLLLWISAKNESLNSSVSMQRAIALDSLPRRIQNGDYELAIE